MKTCFFLVLALFLIASCSSHAQSISAGAGRSGIPGDYFFLRYEQATNSVFYWSAGLHGEVSHRNALNYSAYGLDYLIVYPLTGSRYTDAPLTLKTGLGITWQVQQEPWIYAGYSFAKRMNYGLLADLGAAWYISDEFSCFGFAQQRLFLNSSLGKSSFAFGIGLTFHFN